MMPPTVLRLNGMSFFSFLALGFFLGLRHATDADHVLAVSTIVAHNKKSGIAWQIGAFWGIGHLAMVLLVGILIISFKISVPRTIGIGFEFCVGASLMLLGLFNIRRTREIEIHSHINHRQSWRSFLVGLIHGLAGSTAITLLLMTAIKNSFAAFAYLLVFSLGTFLGMIILSLIMEASILGLKSRVNITERVVVVGTGILSFLIGTLIVYRTGQCW
jgi:high-affinity nickel permease